MNKTDLVVEELLPYMPAISGCQRSLSELNFAWRLIESTAKMVCPLEAKTILPTMRATREGFNKLEKELVANLVHENITKSVQEIHFKAQVIIDIVVRNLFERTADVGFLAMDTAIRDFILSGQRDDADIVARLAAYRDKYTVYDEILILTPDGKVLTHLDTNSSVTESRDPLIAATLQSNEYVETFGKSDLRPELERCLIYSRRITDPATSAVIGVLCLCFRFEQEMQSVFAGLTKAGDRSLMLMLDAHGRVIASNDAEHIPLNRQLQTVLDANYGIVSYGGQEYLACTCAAQNYQGYRGPGWLGHVMIPLSTAFRRTGGDALAAYDAATLAGVMQHAQRFCPPLYQVSSEAKNINTALRRVVWNGQVTSSSRSGDSLKLKAILQEISQTGDETSDVFAESIRNLYATVLSSSLQDTQFISRLAIDIMDRNLYERANDCRWWALAPDLRRLMAQRQRSAADLAQISATLDSINALYTAYTRLVVFDTEGMIVAASNLHGDTIDAVGQHFDTKLVSATLALRSSQHYCVSPFEPSWLYADRPTYIYCAALRDPNEASRVVGGIGIVFDAEPEFRNILNSALPKRPGAFGLFVDRSGTVISSTAERLAPLDRIEIESTILSAPNGNGAARIIVHDNQYMIAGHTTSFGYREFKNSGDYSNDVIALVLVPIGPRDAGPLNSPALTSKTGSTAGIEDSDEYALFSIGADLYAIAASSVIEAVDGSRVNPASTLKPLVLGALDFQIEGSARSIFVPVIDSVYLFNPERSGSTEHAQVIVLKQDNHVFGLVVDSLTQVSAFALSAIEPVPDLLKHHNRYVKQLIKTGSADLMIQVLDCAALAQPLFAR